MTIVWAPVLAQRAQIIRYYNILWAEQIEHNSSSQVIIVKIFYADQTGKLTLSPETITVKFIVNNDLTSPILFQPQPIPELEPDAGPYICRQHE